MKTQHGEGPRTAKMGLAPALGWLVLAVLSPSLVLDAPAPAASLDEKDSFLRYGERALQSSDFAGPVPANRPETDPPIRAYSETVVRYRFQSRHVKARGKTRAELTGIEFYAVMDRAKSWNDDPDGVPHLDHHQGHFDLAQITALTANIEFAKRMRREKISAEGRDALEADRQLDERIRAIFRPFHEDLRRDREYFDERTRYGTDAEHEKEERAKQRMRLASLSADPASRGNLH